MSKPKILAFAGSAREDSVNKKLVRLGARAAEAHGAEVSLVDLRDYPLPLFDQDLEARQGAPEACIELKKHFLASDGLLIAAPEYNSSITPLLKNTIDWLSRPAPGEPALAAFRGKVAGLLSASPGALGGLRGLVHVRAILGNIGVVVIPDQLAVSSAYDAFDDQGALTDSKLQSRLETVVQRLVEVTQKLTS